MEQKILTHTQKRVLEIVSQEKKLNGFYLSGGTALAEYYFQHRLSEDLDFFIFDEPDKIFLHSFAENLKTIMKAKKLGFQRLYDRNIFVFSFDKEELKLEFTKYPFPELEKCIIRDGIKIDSLRDIAANKLMTLLDRFDPKDFVDLYFIFKKFKPEQVRKDMEKKFGVKINDMTLGGEFAKARHIEALPKMVKEISVEEIKNFFTKKAKELEPNIFL